MIHTVYLCDRKACIFDGTDYCTYDYCKHTQKPNHAINGPCEAPEDHPERFEAIETRIGIVYKEKEDYKKNEEEIAESDSN